MQKSMDKIDTVNKELLETLINTTKEVSRKDNNSLLHTKWECKYHLVFAPKYRRQIVYGRLKADVASILSELCKRKGIEISKDF